MAGDWIKLEHATPTKPEIYRLARLLGVSRGDAFLLAVEWWMWLDRNSSDGNVTHLALQDIDDLMHCPGFAAAMDDVKWLLKGADGLTIVTPNFARHNGETAKNRALTKDRMEAKRVRDSYENVTQESSLEKRREDITTTPCPDAFDKFWAAYPRKEKKPAAMVAFRKLKADDALLSRMLSAISIAKRTPAWLRDDGNYIPHASSWLNQRRWEDEPNGSVSTPAKKVAL